MTRTAWTICPSSSSMTFSRNTPSGGRTLSASGYGFRIWDRGPWQWWEWSGTSAIGGLAGDDHARVRDQFYYPFAQVPDTLVRRWSELMSIAVRTSIAPLSLVEPLRREVRGATGDQVLYEVHTMEELSSATLARQRFLLLLFGIFAGLALLLACVGIYGVMAYVTSRRVPEIGVRMALGARPGDVVAMVLRQSMNMIATGVIAGVVAAYAAGRLLERLVTGMLPGEPLTFAAMISVLMTAALFASFVPARRASRVDPTSALRQE